MLASMLIPIIYSLSHCFFLNKYCRKCTKKCNQRTVSAHINHNGHIDIMNTDNKDREYAGSYFGKAESFELNILKRKLLICGEEPSSPLQLLRLCFLSAGTQTGWVQRGKLRKRKKDESGGGGWGWGGWGVKGGSADPVKPQECEMWEKKSRFTKQRHETKVLLHFRSKWTTAAPFSRKTV